MRVSTKRRWRVVIETLIVGAALAGALLLRLPGSDGFESRVLGAVLPLGALIGVRLRSRAQTRAQWQAAWTAYAEQDLSDRSLVLAGASGN